MPEPVAAIHGISNDVPGVHALMDSHFVLDERRLNDKAAELFEALHLHLGPRARVSGLGVAQQQMVEIARALSFKAAVLIMDEPTAALTGIEIDDLFRIIRQLRDGGV